MRPVVVACSLATMLVVTHLPVDLPAEEEVHGVVDWADAAAGGERDELAPGGVVADGADLDDLAVDTAEAPAPHPVVVPWTGRARVTAYCLQNYMASGRWVYVGAIATDRRVIPAGSLVEIEGLGGSYVSEDTGSGIRGWWIDLYMPSCRDAINWGNQYRQVRVHRWGW